MPVENPASLKVDNEKLRGILTRCDEYLAEKGVIRDAKLRREIRAALSQQAEPIEPAPAQNEREAYSVWRASNVQKERTDTNGYHAFKAGAAWQRTRPAQTEQEPIRLPERKRTDHLPKEYKTMTVVRAGLEAYNRALDDVAALNAAQTAQQPEQSGLVEALEKYADDRNWCFDTCNIDRDIAKDALAAYHAALSAQGASK